MKILLISSRFPWPSHTGDRLRAATWIAALAPHARVALVAPDGEVPAGVPPFDFYPVDRSASHAFRSVFSVLRKGLPLQTLLAAPYAWRKSIAAAQRDAGPFDTSVVLLSRVEPWVRGSLNGGLKILDAVDSLRRNAEQRELAATRLSGWLWRHEARRLAAAEHGAARRWDRVLVVSSEEQREFGGAATVVPNSIPVRPLDAHAARSVGVAFWGRLRYFANAHAARMLVEELAARIHARVASATIALAGAAASRTLARSAARQNVALHSPIDDMAAFARSVRVALFPVRYGGGQLTKVLEAAEAGCAIVATSHAMRGLDALRPHVVIADEPESLADATIELLRDDARREAMGSALRAAFLTHHSRERVLAQLASIAGVARA